MRNGYVYPFGLAALFGIWACMMPKHAEAAIRIQLTFTIIEHEFWPRQQDHQTPTVIHYTLSGKSIAFESSNGTNNTYSIGKNRTVSDLKGTHKVTTSLSRQTIVSTSVYKNDIVTTRIVTNGVDACQAERTLRLKPGMAYILEHRKSNGEEMHVSGYDFINMTCSIEN